MSDGLDRSILDALARTQPSSVPEIAAELETHTLRVRRRCQRLQRSGQIRQTTGGVYVATGDGRVGFAASD